MATKDKQDVPERTPSPGKFKVEWFSTAELVTLRAFFFTKLLIDLGFLLFLQFKR